MNPWGIVVLALGAIIIWIGVRGTQGSLYADIFGHAYTPSGNSPASIQPINSPGQLTQPGASPSPYGTFTTPYGTYNTPAPGTAETPYTGSGSLPAPTPESAPVPAGLLI